MFRVAPGNVGFGEVCGVAPGGVVAYSNGSDYFFSGERNIVEGASTGFQYQCVEFARRWLLQRKGLWLPDVPWAAHIFSMESVEDAVTGATVPMKGIANGKGDRPTVDTLLIFPSSDDYPPGHIAAIVEVTPTHVRIADQNAHFHKWAEGEHWSDEIPIIEENGTFTLKDKWNRVPLGWMTFPETATRPLDAPAVKLNAKYIEAPLDAFELNRVTFVPKPSEGKVWLDTTNPAQAKFVEAFGLDANRSRLDESEANYYTMNTELWFACTRAGHSLHKLAIEATKKVLASDELMATFGLPQQYWARIRRSFETQPYAISGRFDFVIDAEGKQLKTFEYNADSASTLLECAVIQDKWAEHVGVAGDQSFSSGRRIGSLLEHAWREAIAGGVVEKGSKLHCLVDNDKEEQYTALYVMEKAEAAGLKTELCTMFDGLEWRGGRVVDKSSGTPVKTVWKTWAWETAISDAAKAATERPADWTPKDGDAVRLCDVLLGDENIHIFEPMWKLIPGNKAIMAVMSEMEPDHPNLLRTEWKLSETLRQKGYARKPIVGRCGLNVTVHAPGGEVLHETHGQFGNREMVYQELFQLPKRDDYYAILGGWVIGAIYAGTGLREDKSIVTNVESPFSAIRIKVPFKPKLVTHENATDDHLNLKKDKEESK